MKKTKFSAICLVAVLAFSPVSVMASQKVNVNAKSSPVKQADAQWTAGSIKTEKNSSYVQEWEIKIPADDISKFVIDNEVGNVVIEAYDEKDIKVKAEVRLTGYNSAVNSKVLEKSSMNYTLTDNVLTLNTVEKNSKKSMYQWLRDNYTSTQYNFSVNYTVYINKDSNLIYDIDYSVGNLLIDGLKGNFNIQTEVGNLSVTSPAVSGECIVKTSVGNVNMDFGSINDADKITGSSEVGNVNISFNKNANYTLTKSTIFQKSATVKNGTGKTVINLSTEVGNASYSTN